MPTKLPKTRKLLLQESIKKLGKVGDVVDVSAGYARNYLIPHGLAAEPTKGNLEKVAARRAEIERQEAEKRKRQEGQLEKLKTVQLTLQRRANELGRLFGSVGASELAHELQAQGYEVEAEDIELPGKLDRLDAYTVRISFAKDLETEIKVYVAPDPESREAIEVYQKERRAAEAADLARSREEAAAATAAPAPAAAAEK